MKERMERREEEREGGRKEGMKEGRKGVCSHAVVYVTVKGSTRLLACWTYFFFLFMKGLISHTIN